MTPPPEPRTALDNLWQELEMDALASDGPIADRDVKNAIAHWRPRIEAEAAGAPLREALKAVLSLSARYEDERAPKVLWQARAALAALAATPARCQQTNGIGIPRWPNDRCILNEDHDSDHQYTPIPAPLDVEAAAIRRCIEQVVAVWPTDLAGIMEALNAARR